MKWNKVVFNHKQCDHDPNCSAKRDCIEALGSDTSPIYYDSSQGCIVLDEAKCVSSCSRICTICPLFIKVDNANEYWLAKDEIKKIKKDKDFRNRDMYSSGWASPCHKTTIDIVRECMMNEHTFILEVNNKIGCLAEYVLIEILSLMPKDIYDRYYKKLLLEDIGEIEIAEQLLGINELPCMLLIIDGKVTKEVHGVYKKDTTSRKKILEAKIQDFCSTIRGKNNG